MEGPLSVWTNSVSGWHLCWVVLDDRSGMLYRFKSHDQRRQRYGLLVKLSGINLLGAIVAKDPRERNGFSIISEGQEYRFQASSEDERDAWVMELEEAVLRQMVCRRAYHIWDRRYIGPTLALVNAKLQDAGLLYEELACSLQELDRRWSTEEASQRARWPGVIRDLLAFLTTARAAMALLENVKEMILPGLVAQLDTMHPRKKAATMLSLLRTQAAGLAVDPLSALLRRNPKPAAEGAALLQPTARRSPRMPRHPTLAAARRSPNAGAHAEPAARCCAPPRAADDSPGGSDSADSSLLRFATASADHSAETHADKSSRSMATAPSKRSSVVAQESSETSEGSSTAHEASSVAGGPTEPGWQLDAVRRRGARSPLKKRSRSPTVLPTAMLSSNAWAEEEEEHGPTARSLRELCGPLRFGASLLPLDYPVSLLQPRSALQALADLFACPELFTEIGASTRASERMLRVLRWYLAGLYYVKRSDDATKPLSPVLGETHRCSWQLRCGDLCYVAEQVSVFPPQTCLYAESAASGIRASAQLQPEAFCVGSYLQLRLRGKVSLYLSQYAEEYHLELPAGCVRNVSSKPWFELCGIVNVRCRETGYRARMKFMAKPPVPGSQKHCVHTDVYNPVSERPFVRLRGRWTDSVTATWASGDMEPCCRCTAPKALSRGLSTPAGSPAVSRHRLRTHAIQERRGHVYLQG
ncbi:oxysterol-binding protein-related protein 9-like isoform X3 [Amblyomma americanum]